VDKAAIPVDNRVSLWRSRASCPSDSGLAQDLGTARRNRPQAKPAAVHDSARAIHRTGLVVHLEIVPG